MVRNAEELKSIADDYISLVSKVFYIKKAILFGSYASGNPHAESDIDIALVSDDFEFIPYDVLLKILFKIARNVDTSIEPIALTPEEYKAPQLGSVAYDMVNKGRILM